MAAPFNPNPTYSSTYQPGYTNNPSVGGNNDWKKAALATLNYKWASMTPQERIDMGWTSGWTGQLDPTDGVAADGTVYTSPQTVATFSKYLDTYQPNSNSWLDSVLPYVAPQPNEYVESAESIANRWTMYNADRAFGLDVDAQALDKYKADLNASLTEKSIAAQSAASARSAAAQLQAAQIGANASKYGTQGQFLSSIYNTEGGIYSGQENNRLGAMGQAGQLGLGLQGIYDERVNNIIKNLSNPADFVERTYATRALESPTPSGSVGYTDAPGINEAISKLLDWKASAAPTAPSLPGAGGGQTTVRKTRNGQQTISAAGGFDDVVEKPTTFNVAEAGPEKVTVTPISQALSTGTGGSINPQPLAQTSYGNDNQSFPTEVLGQESWRSKPPTGINDRHIDANGTIWVANPQNGGQWIPDSAAQNQNPPQPAAQPGKLVQYWGGWWDPANGPIPPMPQPGGTPHLKTPGTTRNRSFRDRPLEGGEDSRISSIYERIRNKFKDVYPPGENTLPVEPPPEDTTQPPPAGTTGPQIDIPTYGDEAINQSPFLKYILGMMSPEQFNTISTAYKSGPFGTTLPMGGALNLQKLYEIAQNPDDLAMLGSLYKGANRNLDAEAQMARMYAPYGQGLRPSSIYT